MVVLKSKQSGSSRHQHSTRASTQILSGHRLKEVAAPQQFDTFGDLSGVIGVELWAKNSLACCSLLPALSRLTVGVNGVFEQLYVPDVL